MLMGGGDLQLAFAADKVPEKVQAMFYHVGCTSLRAFGTFASSASDFRVMLKDQMGIDEMESLVKRALVARLAAAWISASRMGRHGSRHCGR